MQIILWAETSKKVTTVLEGLKVCSESQKLVSSAQKFAVFLAMREAKVWAAIMNQFAKSLSIFAIMAGGGNLLIKMQQSDFDLMKYLNQPELYLYVMFMIQALNVLILYYITHSVTEFQKTFPSNQKTTIS